MKNLNIIAVVSSVVLSSSVNAALVERLGGLAYYDDEANITWLTDANYAGTTSYAYSGWMNWTDASNWADGLVIEGISGWRLPDTGFSMARNCNGYNCTDSEMGNLFYNVLGNSEDQLLNTGPFINLNNAKYWSSTENTAATSYLFNFRDGEQLVEEKNNLYRYAWAVYSGDVGIGGLAPNPVPVPAAIWLFGSGLLGLVGVSRRNKSKRIA